MQWRLMIALAAIALSQPQEATVPVVVELFTSEGCSSCPPADVVLSKLAKEGAIAGAQVIPLGLHVTYWDELGWKDPASLKSATDRQQSYGSVWGEDRVYTPQAVIDGHQELVGSDEDGIRRAVAKAAKEAHAKLAFTAALDGEQILTTLALISPPPGLKEPLDVRLFVTEDGLTSVVKRGENGGRTLYHDAVVRLEQRWDGAPGTAPSHIPIRGIRPEWKRDRLKAIVLVSGRKTHRIFGAASVPLK